MDVYHNVSVSSDASSRSLSSSVLRLPVVAIRAGLYGARTLYFSIAYALRTGVATVHLFFRPLTIQQVQARLRGLRPVVRTLESFIRIPFVARRFGILTLLGLIPFAAPIASALVSAYPLILASQIQASLASPASYCRAETSDQDLPQHALWRMYGNLGIAVGLGCVPFVGG